MPKELLDVLSKEHLSSLARYHSEIARQLQFRAAEIDRRQEQKQAVENHLSNLRNTGVLVSKYMSAGLSYDAAVRATVASTGFDKMCVEENFKQQMKRNKFAADKSRELAIIRMARSGKTNKDIAARLGIHRNTVSRVIRKALEALQLSSTITRKGTHK